jgi:glycosyltransferase involved in cell wall biosynthesis
MTLSEMATLAPGQDSPPAPPAPANDPRRVLAVVRWPLGGIRTHLLYTYPRLSEAGYRFTFLLPDDSSLPQLARELGRLEGAELVGVPVRGPRCRLWLAAWRQLRGGRFDLIHSHGMTAAVHATLANLGRGTPHVVTLHEPLRPGQFPGWRGRCRRWALGRLLARASALVTVSDDARANLLAYLPILQAHADRLHTIQHGIDLDPPESSGTPALAAFRRKLALKPGTMLLGFLGRFMPEKGFPVLLEALQQLTARKELPPFHLVAFGSGDYRREYQEEIRWRSLERHVTLHDFVPAVQPVLAQLDLVVVPSLWEASSLVSMEAMAAGVPVLGSDCPGLREVLRDTPSRTVAAGSATALRIGLEQALRSPWTEEARAFVPQARARFDGARSAGRLQEVFAHVLTKRIAQSLIPK